MSFNPNTPNERLKNAVVQVLFNYFANNSDQQISIPVMKKHFLFGSGPNCDLIYKHWEKNAFELITNEYPSASGAETTYQVKIHKLGSQTTLFEVEHGKMKKIDEEFFVLSGCYHEFCVKSSTSRESEKEIITIFRLDGQKAKGTENYPIQKANESNSNSSQQLTFNPYKYINTTENFDPNNAPNNFASLSLIDATSPSKSETHYLICEKSFLIGGLKRAPADVYRHIQIPEFAPLAFEIYFDELNKEFFLRNLSPEITSISGFFNSFNDINKEHEKIQVPQTLFLLNNGFSFEARSQDSISATKSHTRKFQFNILSKEEENEVKNNFSLIPRSNNNFTKQILSPKKIIPVSSSSTSTATPRKLRMTDLFPPKPQNPNNFFVSKLPTPNLDSSFNNYVNLKQKSHNVMDLQLPNELNELVYEDILDDPSIPSFKFKYLILNNEVVIGNQAQTTTTSQNPSITEDPFLFDQIVINELPEHAIKVIFSENMKQITVLNMWHQCDPEEEFVLISATDKSEFGLSSFSISSAATFEIFMKTKNTQTPQNLEASKKRLTFVPVDKNLAEKIKYELNEKKKELRNYQNQTKNLNETENLAILPKLLEKAVTHEKYGSEAQPIEIEDSNETEIIDIDDETTKISPKIPEKNETGDDVRQKKPPHDVTKYTNWGLIRDFQHTPIAEISYKNDGILQRKKKAKKKNRKIHTHYFLINNYPFVIGTKKPRNGIKLPKKCKLEESAVQISLDRESGGLVLENICPEKTSIFINNRNTSVDLFKISEKTLNFELCAKSSESEDDYIMGFCLKIFDDLETKKLIKSFDFIHPQGPPKIVTRLAKKSKIYQTQKQPVQVDPVLPQNKIPNQNPYFETLCETHDNLKGQEKDWIISKLSRYYKRNQLVEVLCKQLLNNEEDLKDYFKRKGIGAINWFLVLQFQFVINGSGISPEKGREKKKKLKQNQNQNQKQQNQSKKVNLNAPGKLYVSQMPKKAMDVSFSENGSKVTLKNVSGNKIQLNCFPDSKTVESFETKTFDLNETGKEHFIDCIMEGNPSKKHNTQRVFRFLIRYLHPKIAANIRNEVFGIPLSLNEDESNGQEKERISSNSGGTEEKQHLAESSNEEKQQKNAQIEISITKSTQDFENEEINQGNIEIMQQMEEIDEEKEENHMKKTDEKEVGEPKTVNSSSITPSEQQKECDKAQYKENQQKRIELQTFEQKENNDQKMVKENQIDQSLHTRNEENQIDQSVHTKNEENSKKDVKISITEDDEVENNEEVKISPVDDEKEEIITETDQLKPKAEEIDEADEQILMNFESQNPVSRKRKRESFHMTFPDEAESFHMTVPDEADAFHVTDLDEEIAQETGNNEAENERKKRKLDSDERWKIFFNEILPNSFK